MNIRIIPFVLFSLTGCEYKVVVETGSSTETDSTTSSAVSSTDTTDTSSTDTSSTSTDSSTDTSSTDTSSTSTDSSTDTTTSTYTMCPIKNPQGITITEVRCSTSTATTDCQTVDVSGTCSDGICTGTCDGTCLATNENGECASLCDGKCVGKCSEGSGCMHTYPLYSGYYTSTVPECVDCSTFNDPPLVAVTCCPGTDHSYQAAMEECMNALQPTEVCQVRVLGASQPHVCAVGSSTCICWAYHDWGSDQQPTVGHVSNSGTDYCQAATLTDPEW